MPGDNIKTGASGEKTACRYLTSKGYTVLETNYRTRFCEIDIIAREKDTLCFIEVKTRQSLRKGLPREAVTLGKQKKILQGAQYYMKDKKVTDQRIRFDVVEVLLGRWPTPQINLIKNAFWAN